MGLAIFICILFNSCKKEYSCENCQTCVIDTTINIYDTAWRFNIGSKLYFGSLDFSTFIYDKQGFSFYGYSQHLPGAIFGLGCRIDPLNFRQNLYNISVSDFETNYGMSSTGTQPVDGFSYKHNGLRGIIKSFDTSTNVVDGYFCGIVIDEKGKDINITNGRFKVKIN